MDELQIGFNLHGSINGYWTSYFVFAIGLLGWVFSRASPWDRQKRIAVSVLYVFVASLSYYPLFQAYIALEAVVEVIGNRAGLSPAVSELHPDVLRAVTARLDMGPWRALLGGRVIPDLGILYFLGVRSGIAPGSPHEALD